MNTNTTHNAPTAAKVRRFDVSLDALDRAVVAQLGGTCRNLENGQSEIDADTAGHLADVCRWTDGEHGMREQVIARAKKDMAKHILVDGELYTRTVKPEYFILTFGCCGDGTGLFVEYPARRDCGWHFPADKGEEAVAKAREIALGRRDFEDAKRFTADIVCY